MNKKIKLLAAVLAVVCAASAFSGCGKKETKKIKYWCTISANLSSTESNLGNTPLGKEIQKRTGYEIEFIHPAGGNAGEKFNLLIASDSLPDIIEYSWVKSYPGGPEKAIADNVIQELDLQKDAPNLYAYIKEHPEMEKFIKTDDGKFYGYPFIRGDEFLLTSAGLIIRQDWLDELGLEMPETIDEWTTVLRAFKNKGVEKPLSMPINNMNNWGAFVGAYDTLGNLYVRDGRVVYGPAEDAYKEFLTQMKAWYDEGLLDVEFATLSGEAVQSNILNGVSGATYGSCGSGIGKWMNAKVDPNMNLVGVKYPVLNKGDKPQFGNYEYPVTGAKTAVITVDSKRKDDCAKLLDYAYSAEGKMLYNFGIEGESYTMVDGYPKYTELITNNPDGLSMGQALAKYALSQDTGAFVQDKRYMEQYAQLPQQQAALTNWMYSDMKNHLMPNVSVTQEQQTELSTIETNINTYRAEMAAKFITGVEPLSKFDEYKKQLKDRGLDKYLRYKQEAYDRFMKR